MAISTNLILRWRSRLRGYAAAPCRLGRQHGRSARRRRLGVIAGHCSPDAGRASDCLTMMNVRLDDELGRPDWRSALVDLGGADAPGWRSRALSSPMRRKRWPQAASDIRSTSLNAWRSSAGQASFSAEPKTRHRAVEAGVEQTAASPRAIRSGYITHTLFCHVGEWRGDAVAAAQLRPLALDRRRRDLGTGDPVLRYDPTTRALDFLTPPPRQAERVALLTGDRTGPWSWRIDRQGLSGRSFDLSGRPSDRSRHDPEDFCGLISERFPLSHP